MASLSFEGETHQELTQKVRRWLASVDGKTEGDPSMADVVNESAELTKDALRILAAQAGPIAQSDLVKALTQMGYKATDATRGAALTGLDALETATGGSVVRKVTNVGTQAFYEMNSQIAKQILRSLTTSRNKP
jgi:hypothetical protein